jgi:hypothetical protein
MAQDWPGLPGYATYCTANAARVPLLSYPVVGQDHRVSLRILAVFGSLLIVTL